MIYGRPSLPQIDLDLAEVSGGGSCPSQFYGKTADGSSVYLRYRGGSLRIDKGEPGVAFDVGTMTEIYRARIGPPFHGDILIEQICDLTGVTVRGERLSLSEEKWARESDDVDVIDFSGRRKYFEVGLCCSDNELPLLLRDLTDHIEGVVVVFEYASVEPNPPERPFYTSQRRLRLHDPSSTNEGEATFYLVNPQKERLYEFLAAEHVTLHALSAACALVVSIDMGSWGDLTRLGRDIDLLHMPDGRDVEVETANYLPGSITTQFEPARSDSAEAFDRLQLWLDHRFSTLLEEIDLETGLRIATGDKRGADCYSVGFTAWCHHHPNRFFRTLRRGDRKVGLRPAL